MTPEMNELLTRVGPGTAMGELMRCYWLPALLSSELPNPGGPALRVRLLGEDLVAFRSTEGEVGLLGAHCPHRRASLFFGRNESGGLRCVYHGWKFGVSGQCLEIPHGGCSDGFRRRARAKAYPCRERNGVVWTFMGTPGDGIDAPGSELPPLPELEWNLTSEDHSVLWRSRRDCNWLQCLEGDLDQYHQSFLHTRLDQSVDDQQYVTVPGNAGPAQTASDALRLVRSIKTPTILMEETEYGLLYASRREYDAGHDYYRIRHFMFPFWTLVGGDLGASEFVYNCKAWVPMDDTHTLILEAQFRPERPWGAEERHQLMEVRNPKGFAPATTEAGGSWNPRANAENDYLRDLDLERSTLFSGILSNPAQDAAMQESMGPIVDRTCERLCGLDANIVRVRRQLARAAERFRDRRTSPPGTADASIYRNRPIGIVLAKGGNWVEQTRAHRIAI
jgi:phthalate 4,5-dioxygenase